MLIGYLVKLETYLYYNLASIFLGGEIHMRFRTSMVRSSDRGEPD
jgi:hypothetical protein